jgi:hypothetical protein
MITLADIDKLINQFYLDSEKDGRAVRPNVILITEDQFEEILKEMGVEDEDDVTIESILGMDVVIANGLEYPRLIRL